MLIKKEKLLKFKKIIEQIKFCLFIKRNQIEFNSLENYQLK